MDAEIAAHIESLETHVARLEGIIHVMLLEIEAGTIQETAAEIRAALPKLDDA
jgi:hypothetical protein